MATLWQETHPKSQKAIVKSNSLATLIYKLILEGNNIW
jgi:hypothetical protein